MSQTSPFQRDILTGKVALITGGGSGIGFGIALELGRHGAKVAIMGRRQNVLDEAVAELQRAGIVAISCQGDVREPADAQRVVQAVTGRFGMLNVLVNGAAGNFLCAAEDLRLKGFNTVMGIDAAGVFNLATNAFPAMRDGGGGVIINISAMLHQPATWFQSHASAAKAAIDSLTRSLALEWGEFGIRVNGIAPGPIKDTPGYTKLGGGMGGNDSSPEERAEAAAAVEALVAETVPLRRVGTKFDIAMAVVFLCSSAGEYVSGDTLTVDGGQWLYKEPMMPREMVSSFSRGVEDRSRGQTTVAKSKL